MEDAEYDEEFCQFYTLIYGAVWHFEKYIYLNR